MSATSPMVATRVGADTPGTRPLLMLHGIFGRGRNWLAVARLLVQRRPDWCCWLADLRHHGDAGPGAEHGTLDMLARDIEAWGQDTAVLPEAVLGHSFGGKVALAYAARQSGRPLHTWVIDSTPEAREPSGSAWEMLRIVRDLPDTFPSRQAAVAGLEARGVGPDVAQWMATNLVRDAGIFRWRLDFAVMEHLLRDFFQTSLWPVLDPGAAGHVIHVLKATRSDVIAATAVTRLTQLQAHPPAAGARVHLAHREGGHWIHAESPGVVVDLLADTLPRGL